MKQISKSICLLLSLVLLVTGCGVSPDAAQDSTPSTGVTGTATTEPIARDVAFLTNTNVRLRTDTAGLEYPVRFGGHVISNKEQYDRMKLEELVLYDWATEPLVVDLTPYTKEYFVDKALVVLFMTSGAGNVRMRVDKLTVSGDTLTVAYTEEKPWAMTDDGSDWCLLLEVDAAAVKDVTTVVGEVTVTTDSADGTTATTSADAPQGAVVSFRENANVQLQAEASGLARFEMFGGHVLFSKAQLDGMKLNEMTLYVSTPEETGYVPLDLTPYTEEYFADKALVVLLMHSGASNVRMRVDNLTVSDNTLMVTYTEERPTILTAEASDWCLLLEVDAAAVKDVTAVVGEKTVENISA